MIASAPASAASAAYAIEAAGVPDETPAITGTRPPAAPTVRSTTVLRSDVLSEPASPIVPVATNPCTPAASSAPALRSSASRSMAPLASNGVVRAGMIPGKRMSQLLVVGHVAPHPLQVLRGVEGGGGGVPVDDRLVDHAVLRSVDAGPAGPGDRIVAQALPERLVPPRGGVIGEAEEHRVGGQRGDLAVEAAVALVPARPVVGRLGGVHGVEEPLRLVVAPCALRGQGGDARLEHQPRLEQVERPGVVRGQLRARRQALERVRGDEGARAGARLDRAA